jgi:hypothetical protein
MQNDVSMMLGAYWRDMIWLDVYTLHIKRISLNDS